MVPHTVVGSEIRPVAVPPKQRYLHTRTSGSGPPMFHGGREPCDPIAPGVSMYHETSGEQVGYNPFPPPGLMGASMVEPSVARARVYSARRCDRNRALVPSQPISVTCREIDQPASQFLSRLTKLAYFFFAACGGGRRHTYGYTVKIWSDHVALPLRGAPQPWDW